MSSQGQRPVHTTSDLFQNLLWLLVSLQQGFDLGTELRIVRAGLIEKRCPLCRGANLDGRQEDRLLGMVLLCHGNFR